MLYPEPPLNFPHQLMINTRFLLLMTNEDGLRTMVTNKRLARLLHQVRKRRAIDLEVAGFGPVNCCFFPSLCDSCYSKSATRFTHLRTTPSAVLQPNLVPQAMELWLLRSLVLKVSMSHIMEQTQGCTCQWRQSRG